MKLLRGVKVENTLRVISCFLFVFRSSSFVVLMSSVYIYNAEGRQNEEKWNSKEMSALFIIQDGSCLLFLQLHVKETPSSATATCASTTLWSAMESRTVCTPGMRTTAKVQVQVRGVELDSSQSSCLCCVPMSREEEAQHPGDSGQHQPHHHRSHLWPGAHPAHHLRHHPAQTTSQEVHHPQVPTLCSAPTCCCFSVKAVYLQLPGWLCFRLIFMLLLVF